MNIRDIKIGLQIKLGLSILLSFVIALSAIPYQMNEKLQSQTEVIYNHPLKVTRAAGMLRADVLSMSHEMKDRFLETDSSRIKFDLKQIDDLNSHALEMIDVLYINYLGPREDIDSIRQNLELWNRIRYQTINLLQTGRNDEAAKRNTDFGVEEIREKILLGFIDKVIVFANDKGESLYLNSIALKRKLNLQLILLTVLFIGLSFIINYLLLRNIRKPLTEINKAANMFHAGDMNVRSRYSSKNEFGDLSNSFNILVENIQLNTELSNKSNDLAGLMLSQDDARQFFQTVLNALSTHTSSVMAAVYLLRRDTDTFEHFESVGLDSNARQSFSSNSFEGEFGPSIASKKVHHFKDIPETTRFVFNTVSGRFIPREIITIPLVSGNEVIAIISLGSLNNYSQVSLKLIDKISLTLSARVQGILAYRQIKDFLLKLEKQNSELEAQKTELSSQSAELLEQNAELEMQKSQLGEASRLKTNFLSNMSHELRTPLNSVIALSGVLNRRLASTIPEEEHSYIEVIERNGKHLLDLINDILDIARIEAGREDMEITNFSPGNLIEEVISMIKPQAKQKNIDLLFKSRGADKPIMSDSSKLRHIIQNLIGNAVKFTEIGQVVVSTSFAEEGISISVKDTGIGISQNSMEHIFDEFRQADSSTSRRYGGTGLGLAIAKKYANLLGGNISVKSEENKGSEFIVTLPLNYAAENIIVDKETISYFKSPIANNPPASVNTSSSKTILLVEDSEPAIIQIKYFLEESGYQILTANNGVEALSIISHTIPDAMILDLMMPEIDGFEVLKQIRNAEPTAHIPVLILTAKHITKEELKFLKRNNIHQLIQKGAVSKAELMDSLSAMLFPVTAEPAKQNRQLQNIVGKPTVLVVEDNPDNMLTVKALLRDTFTVFEATNGYEAVDKCTELKPNLVLMDIALPGMDGIEAFKTIRRDTRLQQIPVIALTASAMISDREIILAHGFDAYLSKPIEEKVFFKVINKTLYGV